MVKGKHSAAPVETPAEDVADVTDASDAEAEPAAEANAEPVAEDVALAGAIDTVAEPDGPAYEGARDGLLLRLEEVCHYARAFDYPLDDTARGLIAELAAHG
jgi:hypothetical protein